MISSPVRPAVELPAGFVPLLRVPAFAVAVLLLVALVAAAAFASGSASRAMTVFRTF